MITRPWSLSWSRSTRSTNRPFLGLILAVYQDGFPNKIWKFGSFFEFFLVRTSAASSSCEEVISATSYDEFSQVLQPATAAVILSFICLRCCYCCYCCYGCLHSPATRFAYFGRTYNCFCFLAYIQILSIVTYNFWDSGVKIVSDNFWDHPPNGWGCIQTDIYTTIWTYFTWSKVPTAGIPQPFGNLPVKAEPLVSVAGRQISLTVAWSKFGFPKNHRAITWFPPRIISSESLFFLTHTHDYAKKEHGKEDANQLG